MKTAIIGAGNVGRALAQAAVSAGHTVRVSATTPESAQDAASATGADAASSNLEAVQDAELVVLAVPHQAVADVVSEIGAELQGAVVVDSTNPVNDTYTGLTTNGSSAAEELATQLAGTPVVKAFNTIFASRHSAPTEGGQPLDAFIAGDDEAAKASVGEFASSLGYRVIDAGGLRMARSLEEMAFLNITLNAANGWPWQSAWKLVGPTGGDL